MRTMLELVGRSINLATGQAVLVKSVREQNVIPPTDWLACCVKVPDNRTTWSDGRHVVGFDLDVEFEDGKVLTAWCAENDPMLKFYDIDAAIRKMGAYGVIFSAVPEVK